MLPTNPLRSPPYDIAPPRAEKFGSSGSLILRGRTDRVAIWLVSAMVALIAVRVIDFLPQLAPIRPALVLTLAGGAYVWSVSSKDVRRSLTRDRTFLLALAYLAWATLTIPFALWPSWAFSTVRGLLVAVMVLGSLLLLFPSIEAVRRIKIAFVGASFISACFLLIAGSETIDSRLQVGSSLDSNDIAAMFAIALPLALGLARHETGWRRVTWLTGGALLAFGVVSTGSRGGSLALLAGLLVFVAGFTGAKRLLFALAGGVILVFAWNAAPAEYRGRMTALIQGEKDYNYTEFAGRKQIWARARGYWLESPVIGVGAGNFPMAEGDYLDAMGRHGKWSAAHNAYLQAFVELGTPGGVLLIWLLLATARRALPLYRPHAHRLSHQPELLAAVAALGSASYFLSHAYMIHLFAICGLVALADQASTQVGAVGPRSAPIPAPHFRRAQIYGHRGVTRV